MRKVINFMSLMKESSFFLDIHFPNPEVFCKVFKDNQSCIAVSKSKIITKTISLLSIIVYRDLYKIRLFGYALLLKEKKQQKTSLSHSAKYYASLQEENSLYSDLKG